MLKINLANPKIKKAGCRGATPTETLSRVFAKHANFDDQVNLSRHDHAFLQACSYRSKWDPELLEFFFTLYSVPEARTK